MGGSVCLSVCLSVYLSVCLSIYRNHLPVVQFQNYTSSLECVSLPGMLSSEGPPSPPRLNFMGTNMFTATSWMRIWGALKNWFPRGFTAQNSVFFFVIYSKSVFINNIIQIILWIKNQNKLHLQCYSECECTVTIEIWTLCTIFVKIKDTCEY